MSACADKWTLLHAMIDGELDAANCVAIEAHIKTCAGCAEELARIEAVHDALSHAGMKHRAPSALHVKIAAQIDGQSGGGITARPQQRSIRPWLAGGLSAIAASLLLFAAVPQLTATGIEDQVIASHVRSLLANHLTDIATSDRHIIKPWFNGKVDFAPPVIELADQGFPLAGGRLDYLDGQVVPALVYHRGLHSINVFVRPARNMVSPGEIATRRNGFSIVRWSHGGLECWAVSDIDLNELKLFGRDFEAKLA